MPVYRAKINYDRSGILYPRGTQVSLTAEEALEDVNNGTLELIGPDPVETPASKPKTPPGGENKTPPGGETK
jgi:hypothetical protein